MTATWRATLLVIVSACCFGSISPLTAIALEHGAALQGVQTWRYATTATLLTLYALWRGRRGARGSSDAEARPTPSRPWWHPRILLLAGLPQASVATLALLALRWVPAATASFLFYTFPAWVALISAVRGTEPLTRTRVGALLLALAGITVMVGAPDAASLHPAGIVSSIAGALLYAAYIPVLSHLSERYPPVEVARAIAVGGTSMFLVWAIATGALLDGFDAVALGASMLQGVLSAAAFLGFLAGLSALGPVRTAITSTVEPFWTTVLATLLLAQPIGRSTIAGGVAIMAAVVLLQRSSPTAEETVATATPEMPGVVPGVANPAIHSSSAQQGDHGGHPSP